jgi:hypothetical protein
MLRIFLFGLSNRRKQPERYTKFFCAQIFLKNNCSNKKLKLSGTRAFRGAVG